MAVDTPAKRASALTFQSPTPHLVLPPPDASVDSGDKSHMLLLYAGIAPSAPAAVTLLGPLALLKVGR